MTGSAPSAFSTSIPSFHKIAIVAQADKIGDTTDLLQLYSLGRENKMTWYSVSLGDGMMAGTPSAEIEEKFLEEFSAAGRPLEMAVFTRPESEGRLYCEVIAYFSPAAANLARKFDALPCEKPARFGLGLLAGDERCWSLLFPG